MLGAIVGDIVGSVYEWNNLKSKDFPLFGSRQGRSGRMRESRLTDDTVMTVAIAQGLLDGGTPEAFVAAIRKFGTVHPNAGYGGRFGRWLQYGAVDGFGGWEPYNSWGNGSAMRVSPCGWWATSLHDAEKLAATSAAVTHNHPEGIKGAQAVAAAIYLARNDASKAEIKTYVENTYRYNLSRNLDDIRPEYKFDVSCQGSVPEAIIAFLESTDFEDAIRNAISIGGDSDTIAAITGSIAEAAYGIPDAIRVEALQRLTPDLLEVVQVWEAKQARANKDA